MKNFSEKIKRIWLLAECTSLVIKIERYLEGARFRINYIPLEPGPVGAMLEKVEDFYPSVVLIQTGYPGFDVFELCRQVKTDPRLKLVPFIIWGSENHSQNAVKAYRAGADYYVAVAAEDYLGLVRLVEKLAEKVHNPPG